MPQRTHRRRLLLGVALVALTPALVVAVLWPFTPSVDDAGARVRTQLTAEHAPELTTLPRPDRVAQALIATEDSRFAWTPGVDPISTLRAGVSFLTGGGDTGAATLEQQLAKNLYFSPDGSLVDKAEEAEVAIKLDVGYPKAEVLRMYLAYVYFGHGFYGLPAASEGYFGLAPAQLSWNQASLLAGLVQSPSADDPVDHLGAALLRQRHVMNRLVATHVLTAQQATAALASPLGLR